VSAVADPVTVPVGRAGARRRLRFLRHRSAQVALAVIVALLAVAFLGGILAPHDPEAQIGVPFGTSSSASPLGLDYRGEDVLSRVLAGGSTVVLYGGAATLLAYLIGGAIGLVAGYRGGFTDPVLMRLMDVLLAFPPVILLLLVATGFGNNPRALILGVVLVQVPSIARILRTATLEVSVRGYVEAAVARGDSLVAILRREILPNVSSTILADAGPRFTVSILLIAAVNFLGLGLDPPAADWSLMISENRAGITINPWAVLAPAIVIGLLTVAINVLADALARTLGTSVDVEALRR
jgi:peptide/nickel transport system permease protein